MQTGIEHMIETRKDRDLALAFKLIVKNEASVKKVSDRLEPYIKKKGEQLYNNENLKKDPKSINNFE